MNVNILNSLKNDTYANIYNRINELNASTKYAIDKIKNLEQNNRDKEFNYFKTKIERYKYNVNCRGIFELDKVP